MYWSLQQHVDESNGYSSTADPSPAPSICGDDECSSLGGELSNFSIDDATSDTTVCSSLVDFEGLWIANLWFAVILLWDTD